jgi:hypothetical protein
MLEFLLPALICSATPYAPTIWCPLLPQLLLLPRIVSVGAPGMNSTDFGTQPHYLVQSMCIVLSCLFFSQFSVGLLVSSLSPCRHTQSMKISHHQLTDTEISWPDDLPDAPEFQEMSETPRSSNTSTLDTRNCQCTLFEPYFFHY